MRPGVLRGPKATRHEAAGDALTPEQWEALPRLLRNPAAVFVDNRTGSLVYVLKDARDARPQLAVRIDYTLRQNRETRVLNAIVSAYRANPSSLAARLAGGVLELIFGAFG
ncbi:hypothetical protein C4N9_09165 [Pararhodobacter marinus]|uniref:Phage MuF C-terminal domain-containing protein n=1 Tax=Pararhodobacter marinus TaxID=2184063 RepID=A0A2U2CAP5_9RHOB|nr:hypothetical protein [Pararhodobacter marinus]PWE28978.1 hypothetical protein C4N9_09165 [Pararhodobacter marinus]